MIQNSDDEPLYEVIKEVHDHQRVTLIRVVVIWIWHRRGKASEDEKF